MSGKGESKLSVLAAIAANIAIGVIKFIAAAISGSAAMLSEGIHSIVDSGNGLLILYGMKRASKAPDREHPLGHGKELYFWCLVVAVSIFAVGGGVSLMKGIDAWMHPAEAEGGVILTYLILVISAIIEGISMMVALKQFNLARGDKKPLRFIRECKDPSYYTVVFEDSAAEAGLLFALIGFTLSLLTGNPRFDATASILIGLLLMAVATVLLIESKALLIGEGMTREELARINALVEQDPDVDDCGDIVTLYMGPETMLLTIDAAFKPGITAQQMLAAIARIEASITAEFPQAKRIFIEAESLLRSEEQHRALVRMMQED